MNMSNTYKTILNDYFRIIYPMITFQCWFYVFFVYYVMDLPYIALDGAVLSTAVLGAYLIKKNFGLIWGGNTMILFPFLWVLLFVLNSGGMYSPSIPWLAIIPNMSGIFLGKRSSNIWSIIIIVTVVLLIAFSHFIPPSQLSDQQSDIFLFSTFCGISIFLFISTRYTDLINQTLVKVEQEKTENSQKMLRILSHDINNQLTIITGASMLIERNLSPEESLRKIKNSTKNITRIFDNVRQWQSVKLGLAKIPLENVIPQDIETYIQAVFSEECIKKQLEIKYDFNDHFEIQTGREFYFDHILSNLVNNAIKFAPPQTHIYITTINQCEHIDLIISNEFSNELPPNLNELFDFNFNRPRIGSAGELGSGFGLPIVRDFLDQFNFKYDAYTKDNRFHVVIRHFK